MKQLDQSLFHPIKTFYESSASNAIPSRSVRNGIFPYSDTPLTFIPDGNIPQLRTLFFYIQ